MQIKTSDLWAMNIYTTIFLIAINITSTEATSVSNSKAKEDEKWLERAGTLQTLFRPIYALNKPSMAKWKLVVKIPERFKGVV